MRMVVAGGYYIHPRVRRLLRYTGQEPRTVRVDRVPEYLEEGLLERVMERGPISARPDHSAGSATCGSSSPPTSSGARHLPSTPPKRWRPARREAGWQPVTIPLADGGEGTLEALGGPTETSVVTGPLGAPVEAAWRLADGQAVVEMARASGLQLAGGKEGNDPLAATSRGTGELIAAALDRGARRVIVGVGGSACTDGGRGAVEALEHLAPLDGSRGYRVEVAYDVATVFLDAPRVFGPQKGASPADVEVLTERLRALAQDYRDRFGVDVLGLPGSGPPAGSAAGWPRSAPPCVPGSTSSPTSWGSPQPWRRPTW